MNSQEIRDTLRVLKRPTVIERLKENVPFPKGSVPKNGLPFWEKIPLDSKLPIIEHPEGAFVLYRDKIGKKLWRQSPMNAFRLDDPFCLDVSYDYDPLHDANLAHIYRSPNRRKVLRRQGLISRRGEAICSLYQFNNYRRYLQCIHRDTLKLEYDRMVEDQADQIALNRAQEAAEKAMDLAKQREEREAESQEFRRCLEEEEALRIDRLRERQIYFDERIEEIGRRKTEAQKQRMAESRKYEAGVRHRRAVEEEIRRAKVAAVRQMWRLAEGERMRRQKEQQENLRAFKDKEVKDRWQEKREFQEQRMERNKKLLEQSDEERRLAIELRKRKMEAEHLRMQVLFNKVKSALCKERKEALKNNVFRYIYINECPDESLVGPKASSVGISSRRTTGSTVPSHRKPEPNSTCINDDAQSEKRQYRRKVAMCIQAMEDAATNKPRRKCNILPPKISEASVCVKRPGIYKHQFKTAPCRLFGKAACGDCFTNRCISVWDNQSFDLWSIVRDGKRQDNMQCKEMNNRNNESQDCEREEEENESEDEESLNVQVRTAMDSLLTNAIQGYVHHRVMHSLKEVYHRALGQCRWLVEREERRQAARYGWVCHHALRQDNTLTGSVKTMGYNPCCALCCPRVPKRKTQFNPEKVRRRIETWKRRADRYRTMLEEGVDCASENKRLDSDDDEEETDGGRLDRNFDDFSTKLCRRMILLASQSVDERFKKFTAHRWKILKEVELSVLMERLCNMMLLYDSKEFLKSAEFQWAADILARDVMKEVRAQIRSERRDAAIQRREEHVKGTRKIFRQRPPKSPKCVLPSPKDASSFVYDEPQELSPDDVPLLRLLSRSPHQPSVLSIMAEEVQL